MKAVWWRRTVPMALLWLVVLLGVAWVAGRQSPPGGTDASRSLDAVRLGPGSGEPIAGYLAALPGRLPAGDEVVPALAQFDAERDPASAVALLAGVRPVTAVFRVPLPRVQTALRFQPLAPVDAADPVAGFARQLDLARRSAQRSAAADSARLSGRSARIAAAEAARLAATPCRCVLAVLVVGDRAALTSVAGRQGVRAVQAAPVGTPADGVALAPLLPEQTQVAGPVPDDGPLPP